MDKYHQQCVFHLHRLHNHQNMANLLIQLIQDNGLATGFTPPSINNDITKPSHSSISERQKRFKREFFTDPTGKNNTRKKNYFFG